MPGTYHETVYVDKDGIRIIGVIEAGSRPVLDGQKKLNDAILYSGNSLVVENLELRNYKGNGVMGQAGNNFEIRNNVIVDTGVYGIFPQLGQNGVVEHNVVSGIADAAIYVGMSDNIHVAHNEVFDSVAGIEIENSRHAIVENNYVHDNSGGLLAFVTPGLPIKTTLRRDLPPQLHHRQQPRQFRRARLDRRGHPVRHRHPGDGGRRSRDRGQHHREQQGRRRASSPTTRMPPNITIDPESEPNSDRVRLLGNAMLNNGYEAIAGHQGADAGRAQGRQGADIARVGPSTGSCIVNRGQYVSAGSAISPTARSPIPRQAELPAAAGAGACDRSHRARQGRLPRHLRGCHIYTGRMIGPPVQVIQALYMDNPQGIAEYIAAPTRKRDDYPEMPPQNYLDPETRLAVAKYMLEVTN